MYEAYIDGLRLERRLATELNASGFRPEALAADAIVDPARRSGWALWVAGEPEHLVAIAWPWAFIEMGIPAINPVQIQTNVMLVDQAGRPLSESDALGALVNLVNQLAWQVHARRACDLGQ
jgi:hypothetical protein